MDSSIHYVYGANVWQGKYAGANVFGKLFDTEVNATDAGKEYLRRHVDAVAVTIFELALVNDQIVNDVHLDTITRESLLELSNRDNEADKLDRKPVKRKLPVVKTDCVYYIGRKNPVNNLSSSFVAVSHCPDEWRSIARYGVRPLWRMNNNSGIFLDINTVSRSAKLRSAIESWAVNKGYCEKQLLRRNLNGGADGQREYQSHSVETCASGTVDGSSEIFVGTKILHERTGVIEINSTNVFGFIAMVWAEETQPKLDGVWWCDELEPEVLRAPGGCVFQSRMSRWNVVCD